MTPKNRERLRAVIHPRHRAMLLNLPAQLMRLAAAPGLRPVKAARLARDAAMIEILLICPMRASNLRMLRIDQHLRRMNPSERHPSHIFVPEHEVKNDEPIEWPLGGETARLIQDYITKYRPALANPGNPYLFPGTEDDQPFSTNALHTAIKDRIYSNIGVTVHPHLMRHFAVWLFLNTNPGQYEIVRHVLGHKSVETTIAAYCSLETDAAAHHFDAVVLGARKAGRMIAAAAFRQTSRVPRNRRISLTNERTA